MRDPELIQVTKVEVEKYYGTKKIHLLKLRNREMKGKNSVQMKKNAHSNERVNKRLEIGNYESISYRG